MKATKSGPIIAKALEPYDDPNPTAVKKIMVFVSVGWYVAPLETSNTQQVTSFTQIDTQTLTTNTLNTQILFIGDHKISLTAAGEVAFDDSVLIANNLLVGGNIEAKEIKAEKFNVATNSAQPNQISNASAGKATLAAGTTELVIPTSRVTAGSLIFVTPSSKTDKVLSVTEKVDKQSFKVEITSPASQDIEFSWWIVN